VPPLKAVLPKLPMPSGGSIAAEAVAAARIRQVLERVRLFGFARHLRCVEHTPEMAFFARAAARGYPDARWIHLVRDGRDVACSLLERGWLGSGREGRAGAGLALAVHRPFWVEPERAAEFEQASEATKAAWAWRAYVAAARSARPEALAIRYEQLAADPLGIAAVIANHLEVPSAPLEASLTRVHARSVGRFRRDLGAAALRDVEQEAGGLLRELGYTSGADRALGAD